MAQPRLCTVPNDQAAPNTRAATNLQAFLAPSQGQRKRTFQEAFDFLDQERPEPVDHPMNHPHFYPSLRRLGITQDPRPGYRMIKSMEGQDRSHLIHNGDTPPIDFNLPQDGVDLGLWRRQYDLETEGQKDMRKEVTVTEFLAATRKWDLSEIPFQYTLSKTPLHGEAQVSDGTTAPQQTQRSRTDEEKRKRLERAHREFVAPQLVHPWIKKTIGEMKQQEVSQQGQEVTPATAHPNRVPSLTFPIQTLSTPDICSGSVSSGSKTKTTKTGEGQRTATQQQATEQGRTITTTGAATAPLSTLTSPEYEDPEDEFHRAHRQAQKNIYARGIPISPSSAKPAIPLPNSKYPTSSKTSTSNRARISNPNSNSDSITALNRVVSMVARELTSTAPQKSTTISTTTQELSTSTPADTNPFTVHSRDTQTTYTRVRSLGEGCNGRVDLFRAPSRPFLVAIKSAAGRPTSTSWKIGNATLKKEVETMENLKLLQAGPSHHENVIRVVESFQAQKHTGGKHSTATINARYLVLEYCELGDLYNVLDLRLAKTWIFDGFFAGILSALRFLDVKPTPGNPDPKKVHCDLKQDNILLRKGADGAVIPVLADFGAANPVTLNSLEPDYNCEDYIGKVCLLDPDWVDAEGGVPTTPALDTFRLVILCAWLGNWGASDTNEGVRELMECHQDGTAVSRGKRTVVHAQIMAAPEFHAVYTRLMKRPGEGEFEEEVLSERRAEKAMRMVELGVRFEGEEGVIATKQEVKALWVGRKPEERAAPVEEEDDDDDVVEDDEEDDEEEDGDNDEEDDEDGTDADEDTEYNDDESDSDWEDGWPHA